VPIDFDLAKAASLVMAEPIRWRESTFQSCRDAFMSGEDYMYLEQPLGAGRIATNQPFGSQLFRRAIATQLGIPQEYNWRDHPHTEVITETIQMLALDLQAAVS
jgi:hypothetical protein